MSKLIKLITELPGDKEIYPMANGGVVAVFEPYIEEGKKKQAVNTTTQEQWDFVTKMKEYKWHEGVWSDIERKTVIFLDTFSYGTIAHAKWINYKILSFSEYLKQEGLKKEWEEFKPVELVKGQIYYLENDISFIFRFKEKDKIDVYDYSSIAIASGVFLSKDSGLVEVDDPDATFRKATPDQKKKLIKAEVENGFYWELEKEKND